VTIRKDLSSIARFDDLDEATAVLPSAQAASAMMHDAATLSGDGDDTNDFGDRDAAATSQRVTTSGTAASQPAADGALSAATMPSLRVAVVAAGLGGEVRVLPIAPNATAPVGAATAVLVPVTDEDAELIVRLFGPISG
jgi:hypothetical protein